MLANLLGCRNRNVCCGRGIGAQLSEELRSRGATVITADILAPADHHCDVSIEEDVAALFGAAGRIDGLVNNAALLVARRSTSDIAVEEFRRVMDINVLGTWLCARAAVQSMNPNGGSIVNVASETAITGSHGFSHYVASKGAVVSLTRSLASEYGPIGIRVNCVAPGFTPTPGSAVLGE